MKGRGATTRGLLSRSLKYDPLLVLHLWSLLFVFRPLFFIVIFAFLLVEVPHNDIWMPNIVVYEEIGVRDYSPRLRSVKIHYDGEVEYREPTVYETSCSIDTAFFPFDVQASIILPACYS